MPRERAARGLEVLPLLPLGVLVDGGRVGRHVAAARAVATGVAGADLVQHVGDGHLALGVYRLGLELLHSVALLLLLLQAVEPLLVRLLLQRPPGLRVSLRAPLAHVVVDARVRLERDLGRAPRAPDEEAKDLDSEVLLLLVGLFARVELSALGQVFTCKITR